MHIHTGTVFQSGGSQAIRIPKECRFPEEVKEVCIIDDGDKMTIMRKKKSLLNFYESCKNEPLNEEFLADRGDVPPLEKELF
jgi:virulence-associated protein VagC